MKRRNFLSFMAGASLTTAALPKPALARGRRELKLVTTWPRNFPGFGTSAQRLANEITLATDNEIKVKLYEAGKIVPAFESFDAVASGKADMYHGVEFYWVPKSKAFAFFAAVPFGLGANEMFAWLQDMGGQELWDELAAGYGIKPFCVGSTGVQMGGWFNKEIETLEDFQGLRMRIPGLGGEVLSRLGAETISLPGGKIIDALKTGKINATEWVGPWNDMILGLDKAARNYYSPGFHEPGTVISLGMNLELWNSLSLSNKTIIKLICDAETKRMLSEYNAKNTVALHKLRQQKTVAMKQFSLELLQKLGKISGEVVAEVASEDRLSLRIYNNFIDARSKLIGWAKHSEEAYYVARRLRFPYAQKNVKLKSPEKSKPKQETTPTAAAQSSQNSANAKTVKPKVVENKARQDFRKIDNLFD